MVLLSISAYVCLLLLLLPLQATTIITNVWTWKSTSHFCFRFVKSDHCLETGAVVNSKVYKKKGNTRVEGVCSPDLDPMVWNRMRVTVLADKEYAKVTINNRHIHTKGNIRMRYEKKAAAGIILRRYWGYNAYFRGFEVKG